MQITDKTIYPQDNIDHNNNNDNSNYYLKNNISDDVSRKIGDVSYHYFNSYMAGFALKTTLALTFTAAVLATALLTTAVPITVPIAVSLGVVALLLINVIKKRKELLFEISLLYTVKNGGHDWCTPVTDNIILGALPLENHKQMLKDLGVTRVLTMIEEFERQPGLINPLSKEDLKSVEIGNLELPSADFIGVRWIRYEMASIL